MGEIAGGLLVLLGITYADTKAEADRLLDKIIGLRIFADGNGKMNRSLVESGEGLMIISQFTLYADTRRGRRPSFVGAAPGDAAERLYDYFVSSAKRKVARVATGSFGAMMSVELVNDGPVTIIIDQDAG